MTTHPLPDVCPEDPATFQARRMRQLYQLSCPPTWDELVDACRDQGARVVRMEMPRLGFYTQIDGTFAVICVHPSADARTLAHELGHHLLTDRAASGILYQFPRWLESAEEETVARFTAALWAPTAPTTCIVQKRRLEAPFSCLDAILCA